MATQVQNRRGTTAQHATFTGAAGEVTVDTDKKTAVVHDGSTAGGVPLLRQDLNNLPAGTIDDADINANAEIAVSKLADGAARQLLQTDAAGTGVEWTSNVDIPGTLDVTSTATFDATAIFPAGSATAASVQVGTGTTYKPGLYSPGADQLAISTGGAGRLFVDSSGNVGIGTSTPNTNGYGGSVLGLFAASNAGGNIWLSSDASAAGNRTGRIGFGTTSNTSQETARIWSLTEGSTAANLGGNLIFNTKADAGALSERMRIDSSGRVGVGTSSPSRILDVRATNTEVRATCASSDYTAFLAAVDSGVSCRIGAYGSNEGFAGTTSNHPFLIQTNNTERLRITNDGYLRLAGKGIQFNGDTADANSLDDYEEGTWTPSIGGTATYSQQVGIYTKVGRLVTASFLLTVTTRGTGSQQAISGLPFTSAANSRYAGSVSRFASLAANTIALSCYVPAVNTLIAFFSVNASGTSGTLDPNVIGDGTTIEGSITYSV